MLKKISMNNFLSFKTETTVDLNATGYKVLTSTNVNNNTLKGAFFFGGNASGKTNAIRAIKVLLDLLFAERNVNMAFYRCLFSNEKALSLTYEFEFSDTRIKYFIEYAMDTKSFVETLSITDEVVLNRIGQSAKSKITENDFYNDIDSNSLLLREIYFNTKFRNQSLLKEWFDFLMNSVYIDGYKETIISPGKLDLDINKYLDHQGVDEINRFFEQFNFNQRIEYSNLSSGNVTTIESPDEKNIFFKREGVGEPIPFPLESLGNQKLLRLLPSFFHVVRHGGLLIVDEFSSGLHNFLEELLIRYFMKHSKNAQLFIVSHSTNLLTNSLLRPDQIYAVDFNGIYGSFLKRFSSEQPRVAQNLEKMYTSGVFGGIPDYRNDYE